MVTYLLTIVGSDENSQKFANSTELLEFALSRAFTDWNDTNSLIQSVTEQMTDLYLAKNGHKTCEGCNG